MTAKNKKTQLWYCATCDEANNFTSKSKHFKIPTHIYTKENMVSIFKILKFLNEELMKWI